MGKIPKINGFLYKNIAGQTLKFSATHLVTPVESSPLLFGDAFQTHAQAHYALIQVLLGGGGENWPGCTYAIKGGLSR